MFGSCGKMDNIWDIYAAKKKVKEAKEERQRILEEEEKANKTPCDNCEKNLLIL